MTARLLLCAALLACGRSEPRLETAVASAAAEANVPEPLLRAIAEVESRGSLEGAGQWIRLVPWRTARDPRRGAALAGVDRDDLDDPAIALRAAAALLGDAARLAHVPRTAPLAAWRPALERFAGGRDPLANQLFADLVLARLGPPAATRFEPRPAGVVGAPFAAFVPLAETAHRPLADRAPTHIVLHTMQNTLPVILEFFRRPGTGVGAHYLVGSHDGTTIQMADERTIVFHDACFNDASIGIEHEGYVEAGTSWYTDAQLRASARLVRDIARRHGIPLDRAHILGHADAPDCSNHTDPGPDWDWPRFMAFVQQPE